MLSSPAAFPVPGEQRPPPAGGRDLRLPRHQGRRAPSCTPARCAAPRAPQAAPALRRPPGRSPPPRAPRRSPPPARSARWRRRPEAPPPRPAFVPSRPRASHRAPRRAASARGRPGSRLSAPRHSRRLRPLYLTSNRTVARPEAAPGSRAGGPRLRLPASRGRPRSSGRKDRAPATPSARHAPPRRTPEAPANPNPPRGGFTNPQPASATRARPLSGPGLWEAGPSWGRRRRPDARASWAVRGPGAHEGGRACALSSGRLAEGARRGVRPGPGDGPRSRAPSTLAGRPRGRGPSPSRGRRPLGGAWDAGGDKEWGVGPAARCRRSETPRRGERPGLPHQYLERQLP